MARNTPSRDQIAHDIFGRKFSALELDQKQYVTKLLGVLHNASRQGVLTNHPQTMMVGPAV